MKPDPVSAGSPRSGSPPGFADSGRPGEDFGLACGEGRAYAPVRTRGICGGPGVPGVGEIGEWCMGRCLWKVVFWVTSPSLRLSRAITTTCPAPGREPGGRASIVFVDGEGVPSPAPPRVIPPRSGAWDDTGEGRDRGRHPGPALPGDITCTAPASGRGRSAKRGRGGERGEQYMDQPPDHALPGLSPRKRPLASAGHFGKGQYGFCRRGGGSLICANLTSLMQYIKEIDARS